MEDLSLAFLSANTLFIYMYICMSYSGPSTDGMRPLLNLLRLLGTEHQWCEDPIESALFIRVQARKAQGPIDFVRILFFCSF